MKYIDAEKLIERLEEMKQAEYENCGGVNSKTGALHEVQELITSLQQEQPEGNLEYWLEHFGMPKENIDNCITQIAQGYGACRYLEGIQHGAEAVNELAQQEQPEGWYNKAAKFWYEHCELNKTKDQRILILNAPTFTELVHDIYELGLNVRKEQLPEIELNKFTDRVDTFKARYKHPEIVSIKGAMAFMARMFYQYPNVARQWYDSLPKATMD